MIAGGAWRGGAGPGEASLGLAVQGKGFIIG